MTTDQKPSAMADDRTRTERALEHIGEQLRSVVLELRVGKVPDLLAAIHDEQQAQTGLLTDLRGAIDDLAEVLRPRPKWADLFGIDPKFNPGGHVAGPADVHEAGGCDECDPDPESVTGVRWPKWILSSSEGDAEGGPPLGERDPNDVDIAICEGCGRHLPCRHCPDTPKSATGDDLSAPQPSEAPEGGEGTERPTAANLGDRHTDTCGCEDR